MGWPLLPTIINSSGPMGHSKLGTGGGLHEQMRPSDLSSSRPECAPWPLEASRGHTHQGSRSELETPYWMARCAEKGAKRAKRRRRDQTDRPLAVWPTTPEWREPLRLLSPPPVPPASPTHPCARARTTALNESLSRLSQFCRRHCRGVVMSETCSVGESDMIVVHTPGDHRSPTKLCCVGRADQMSDWLAI